MSYYVYLLHMKDGRYYVGMTNDLVRRASEHGAKSGSRTTKIFGSEKILYFETYPDQPSAHKREKQLKRWTRAKKEALMRGDKDALRNLSRSRKD